MFCLFTTAAFAAHVVGSLNMKNGWTLEKYAKDGDNTFSHCAIENAWKASSDYNRRKLRGNILYFALKVYESKHMELILGSGGWKLKKDTPYKLTMLFDGGASFTFPNMTATDDETIMSTLFTPSDSDWYSAMMGSNSVELSINGQSIGEFTLDGSRIAMSELLNCWSVSLDNNKFDPSFGGESK